MLIILMKIQELKNMYILFASKIQIDHKNAKTYEPY